MIRKEGLYLGWRWGQASGAVVGRCSGEATRCRQTCSGDEGDRGHRGTPAPLRWALLYKKRNIKLSIQNFGSTPLHGEVSKTYKKTNDTMADMHIYMNGTMADMHKIISNHIYITMSQPLL